MASNFREDLKNAILSHDEVKVSTLRLLISEIKNLEIAKGQPLNEADIVSVIQKEAKKRKEAAAGFRSGGREEQAKREEAELAILEAYLPAQISNEELTKIVEDTITEVGAKSIADMGKVMGVVMGKVSGQADGGTVSALVKQKLS